jgi:hypothetical protein
VTVSPPIWAQEPAHHGPIGVAILVTATPSDSSLEQLAESLTASLGVAFNRTPPLLIVDRSDGWVVRLRGDTIPFVGVRTYVFGTVCRLSSGAPYASVYARDIRTGDSIASVAVPLDYSGWRSNVSAAGVHLAQAILSATQTPNGKSLGSHALADTGQGCIRRASPAPWLAGTWVVTIVLDSQPFGGGRPARDTVRGRINLGRDHQPGSVPRSVNVAAALFGTAEIDFTPFWPRPRLPDTSPSGVVRGAGSLLYPVSAEFYGRDSIVVTLHPLASHGGIELSGRLRGDSLVVGTWSRRSSLSRAAGRFSMGKSTVTHRRLPN